VCALAGCAPAGYNAGAYGGSSNAGYPAGGAADTPPDANADDTASQTLSEDQTTDQLTAAKVKRMGDTVQNENGFVLYRFDGDGNKPAKSNCTGDCEKVWPPALTNDGQPELDGVDAKLVGTITRADGSKQLTLKGWPLYSYVGDLKAGTWKGQNVAGKWFVITSDGTKNLTCLPAVSKPVAPPQNDGGGGSDDSGGGGSDYSY
jgi:predicted lipoprotein with Yx(FWY)xxD motif